MRHRVQNGVTELAGLAIRRIKVMEIFIEKLNTLG